MSIRNFSFGHIASTFSPSLFPSLFLLYGAPTPYHPWCWPKAALPKAAAPVVLTQTGPQQPPCRNALPVRSCRCFAAASPRLLQWCAPLLPICRWMRAPLPPLCKWCFPLRLPKLYRLLPPIIPLWPAWAYCPARRSVLSLPSFPASSRRHFLFFFFFKKRIRPNRVASLGILSGSLPGSSCLPVPVGASLYSFCGAPPILPLCLFPYPITNSQFPPLNSFAFPVLLPFLSVSVV